MEIGISLNSTNETVLVQREGGTKCEIVSLGRPFLSPFLFFSFRSISSSPADLSFNFLSTRRKNFIFGIENEAARLERIKRI